MTPPRIHVARVHDEPRSEDGARLLVDRVWPRGIAKAALRHDDWIREAAPSAELRKWFGHEPARWPGFRERYLAELRDRRVEAMERCLAWARQGPVTLLFSARDRERNQAVVLREHLARKLGEAS